jgi:maleate isomerase
MTERTFPFQTTEIAGPRLGLIALQSDETVEVDLRRLLPPRAEFMVSRVPSSTEVTRDTLAAMEHSLTYSAALFPAGVEFDVIGYGCTSGTATIGQERVAEKIRDGAQTRSVTDPLTALMEACAALGLGRIAILSPYVAQVSERLREQLAQRGIETPLVGTFDIATEAVVVRISAASIFEAAASLMSQGEADALFLSCTNLRALDVIGPLEQNLGKPVLSSNLVMAWHMMRLAGLSPDSGAPGQLMHSF